MLSKIKRLRRLSGVAMDGLKARHQVRLWVLVICFGIFSPFKVDCSEVAESHATRQRVVAEVKNQDFSLLEAEAKKDRSAHARTSSGLWRLSVYYGALSYALDVDRNNAETCGSREGRDGFASWEAAQAFVDSWVKQFPESPTPRLAYALVLMNRAWSYRGCGYADTVDPNVWPIFNEYMERARTYLQANKEMASRDPFWYQLMEQVARDQSWPEPKFKAILDEGISRYPAFYPIYFGAIDYYAPKWGGSDEAIEEFAVGAMKRTEVAEGAGLYARLYWYASQTQYDNSLFSDSRVQWPTMKKGIRDILAKYPDGWNINNFAKFACLAQDKGFTSELISRMGDDLEQDAWGDISIYERCKAWASATPDVTRSGTK